MTPYFLRSDLAFALGGNERLIRGFEEQALAVEETTAKIDGSLEATGAMEDATVLTLSTNAIFNNERVLELGEGLEGEDADGKYRITLKGVAKVANYEATFVAKANSILDLPVLGTLATTGNEEVLKNKTLDKPKLSGLGNYADDVAAATGGVPVGGIYRNGSALMVRVS